MKDFWPSSGFHLMQRDPAGRLIVSEAFLRAYLHRPEMSPIDESCRAERALHGMLLENPRHSVDDETLGGFEDENARENYLIWLDYRDRLLAGGTVEGAYLSLARDTNAVVPLIFRDQLTHVLLRNILDGTDDGLLPRAAEILFRPQKVVSSDDGELYLADAETVEMMGSVNGMADLGALIVQAKAPLRQIDIDLLEEDNADLYWTRDEGYDTLIDISGDGPGLAALCRVFEAWVKHFLDVPVAIEPVDRIDPEEWVWHAGLDPDAAALLQDLSEHQDVGDDRLQRLLGLFRLTFRDPTLMHPRLAGQPVYLAMCMDEDGVLRLRPEILLIGLPLPPAT